MEAKRQGLFGFFSKIGVRLMGVVGVIVLITVAIVFTAIAFLARQENDATIVNIAGRQRMLTQKMTKEALSITSGHNIAANLEALQKTYLLFDKSHSGLLRGDSTMNLPAASDPTILAQLMKVDALWKDFAIHVKTVIAEPPASTASKAAIVAMLGSNTQLLKEMNKGVGLYEAWVGAKVIFLEWLLISELAIALLMAVGCWFMISRKIVRPIEQVNEIIQEMEKGHLEKRLTMNRIDEIGQMARALDAFADSLQHEVADSLQQLADGDLRFDVSPRDSKDTLRNALRKLGIDLNRLIAEIQESGDQIAAGSEQISNSSQNLAHGATESAASLEELTSSLTQLTAQTKLNAENVGRANLFAEEAKLAAESGNSQMQEMVEAMNEINEAGQSINKIIKVIDEIAFQTNLLALNAAVEAARAGQHGKGFAVVAEEVRNLASRSAKAAQETAELIEGSGGKSAKGAEIADKTAESLSRIVSGIAKATDLMGEIASSSNVQAQGITTISEGLEQIDQSIQLSTASSEESAAAAEELASQSESLRNMLRRFKLHPSTPTTQVPRTATPATQVLRTAPSQAQVGWQNIESKVQGNVGSDTEQVVLDDNEFGKY